MTARSWWRVWVLAGVLAVAGSPVLADWTESFEDGNKDGWREHTNSTYDINAFTAVSGVGKDGGWGYERTGLTASDHAEGIFTAGPMPEPVTGELHVMTADLKMATVPGNSRTGIAWGYADTGWPVVHYQIVVQSGNGQTWIEIQKADIQNTVGVTLASGSGKESSSLANTWMTLKGTFEAVAGGLKITAYLDGVYQCSGVDSTPLAFPDHKYYAGVYTGFNSVNEVVFDNVGVSVATATPVIELENTAIPTGAAVVSDAEASGGQAVQQTGQGKDSGSDLFTVSSPKTESAGQYLLTLRLKASDLRDLGKGWRLQVQSGDTILNWTVIHGYHFKGKTGYQEVAIPFELTDWTTPVISMFWVNPDDSSPAVMLDDIQIVRTGDLPTLQITKVWPNKLRYRVTEAGQVEVDVRNTTDAPVAGTVSVELIHDLDPPRPIGARAVSLSPRQQGQLTFPFQHGGDSYGYEVRATASVEGQPVQTAREFFCVSNNPYAVATHANRFSDCEYDRKDWQVGFTSAEYAIPAMMDGSWDTLKHQTTWMIRNWLDLRATDDDLADCARQAREAYTTLWEIYGWSPGACANMNPNEAIWPCGDNDKYLYSRDQLIRSVAALKEHGIGVVSYIASCAQGLDAIALEQSHPEWLCYGAGWSPTLVSPDIGSDTTRQARIDNATQLVAALASASPNDWPGFQWQALLNLNMVVYYGLNWNRPEVLTFVENQVLASISTFGWDGLRWDCGHLNTGQISPQQDPWQPYFDSTGTPLCTTSSQMVSQTVSHLQQFKASIRAVRPDFCFGTNFGSFTETPRYPLMIEELARDGGWLLDEPAARYSWPEYHLDTWANYYKAIADQGERLTALGGHYNPYGMNPLTATGSEALSLYQTVFGLAGHSHPERYFRGRQFAFGDPASFAVRFGRFLFDPAFRKVPSPAASVTIQSSSPLWWQESVLRKQETGRETWVVHLINPPVTGNIEGNVENALPVPVQNAAVSCTVPAGQSVAKAWVLASESWQTGAASATQAVPLVVSISGGKATVSVPEILFWKTVVFEFAEPGVLPEPVTVHGTVVLGNYTGDSDPAGPVPVAVRVELRQGGNPVLVAQKILDANGQFTLDNVTGGTYDVAIKACSWLQKVATGVTIGGSLTDLGTFNLISGDANGDNAVAASDLSPVLADLDTIGK